MEEQSDSMGVINDGGHLQTCLGKHMGITYTVYRERKPPKVTII